MRTTFFYGLAWVGIESALQFDIIWLSKRTRDEVESDASSDPAVPSSGEDLRKRKRYIEPARKPRDVELETATSVDPFS